MKKLADKNISIILINIILILAIIKICKITGFCFTIISLISPLFFGYCISWIIRPLIEKLKKYNIKPLISSILIYLVIISLLVILLATLIPKIIEETTNLLPNLNKFINNNKYLIKIKTFLIDSNLPNNLLGSLNSSFKNVFSTASTILYSFIISFFLSANNLKINHRIFKKVPQKLINKISRNLRIYVKGTFLDMLILFMLASISFFIIKLPGFLILAFLIALTNVIPNIGPYIGGIPAVLIGLSLSTKLGIITLIIVIVLQIVETSFIQPFIMSKSLKLNPILIIIGLIIFSHFFGIVGMIISTPVVSIIKILYDYYKKNKPDWFIKVLDKL